MHRERLSAARPAMEEGTKSKAAEESSVWVGQSEAK